MVVEGAAIKAPLVVVVSQAEVAVVVAPVLPAPIQERGAEQGRRPRQTQNRCHKYRQSHSHRQNQKLKLVGTHHRKNPHPGPVEAAVEVVAADALQAVVAAGARDVSAEVAMAARAVVWVVGVDVVALMLVVRVVPALVEDLV